MRISEHVFRFEDSCQVYLLINGTDAICIDFGTGDVLDHLGDFGVERITDVLMTHHHRDQAQGLPRAAAAGIRIWVPPVEQDLFQWVEEHWQQRSVNNYYNLRQDRFSMLTSVPVYAAVPQYRSLQIGGFEVMTLPTPGHTTGSVSYFVQVDGRRIGFTGDLIYGPGTVWSLAATQWTYTGHGGIAATVLAMNDVLEWHPDLALPSHGEPITEVPAAVALVEPRLRALLDQNRAKPWDLDAWRNQPFEVLSPHLLRNRTANAQSFVLLSDSGSALLMDFGYDMTTDWAAGEDRAARLPWLPSVRVLKKDFGVDRIEVAIPTHYHDDHVAGFNLLRKVEHTQIWAEAAIANILANPDRFDLPCLYHEAIRTDRVVPTDVPLAWREYKITLHPQPGHCLNAVAISTEVDGLRVVATGDQQDGGWIPGIRPEVLNYQYKNGFRPHDYVASAKYYRSLRPDLMLTGHWGVRRVDEAYLDELLRRGEELVQLHEAVLGRDDVDFGPDDSMATIRPYVAVLNPGGSIDYDVEVVNPLRGHGRAVVRMVVPPGWTATPAMREIELEAKQPSVVCFTVTCPPNAGRQRRAVIAADLTVNHRRFGQRAECLVDLR